MPIYEFCCRTCGSRFETIVSIGREKDALCLNCGSKEIQKLVSSFGIGGGSSRIKTSDASCTSCSATACSTCR